MRTTSRTNVRAPPPWRTDGLSTWAEEWHASSGWGSPFRRAGGMVRIGPLSLEHQRRLREMRRRAIGRVAMRAQMVLLSARGYTVSQIAEIFELGEDVVRDWLHRFQERGPDGLEDRP